MHERLSESARQALVENVPVIEAALERIAASVDDSYHECKACKLTVRHNFRDHQLAELVRSTGNKLHGWLKGALKECSEASVAPMGSPRRPADEEA